MRRQDHVERVTIEQCIKRWGADWVAMMLREIASSGTFAFQVVGFFGTYELIVEVEIEEPSYPNFVLVGGQ